MPIPIVSVITPCYNASWGIRDTVESITQQKALRTGRVKLEYIIVDGGSTDDTLEKVKDLIDDFPYGTIRVISEHDQGMYDALAKGLELVTGDYCAYLNAGDYYSPYAFDIIADLFEENPNISWVTGLMVIYNQKGYVEEVIHPYRYLKRWIQCGLYGPYLPWIQQESTFWRTELLQLIDFNKLRSFQYAGDFYLWKQFSQKADLKVIYTYIGGFRKHLNQLSTNIEQYFKEQREIAETPSWKDCILAKIDKWIWKYARAKTKARMSKQYVKLKYL
ncbi:MAG: hypothetical protein K0S74_939 [Chlamydiales bacterium]|jgi:glycosyltransferase involved in cell wall biosynthesis|nr:hypothetical protein [Chlamydiales bacterium]